MEIITKNKKGSALTFVVITLLIVFIMAGIMATIAQTNIKQAGTQEKGLQTYYVARSGAELAYEVIMTTTPSLLDGFKSDINMKLQQKDVDFGDGTADITVTTAKETKKDGTKGEQKIYIESVGKLKNSNITRTVKLEFYINFADYPEVTWS